MLRRQLGHTTKYSDALHIPNTKKNSGSGKCKKANFAIFISGKNFYTGNKKRVIKKKKLNTFTYIKI